MLYPRESETRSHKDLSGLWRFKVDRKDEGLRKSWQLRPLKDTILMPVPASYNDITQDISIRDHIGWVWYETTLFAPASWEGRHVALRFGSVTHSAVAWMNGRQVAEHEGGYLPFEGDVSGVLQYGGQNRLTVAVSNVLDWATIPPGEVVTCSGDDKHPAGYRVQQIWHDFFNYAGLHRPVQLVITPAVRFEDISIETQVRGAQGIVSYQARVMGGACAVRARLLDEQGREVACAAGPAAALEVPAAQRWEPGHPYLYTLVAEARRETGEVLDIYRLPVGIRTIKVTKKRFLINGKPFYFKGFGRHEDSNIRGKGHDDALNAKDFNLMAWIGANSFRTSHYPYSEEIMDLADRQGIVVVDETPAVGLNWNSAGLNFKKDRIGRASQKTLLRTIRELIARDRNHPSVVMWSVANESATHEPGSAAYFRPVFREARKLDRTRPVCIVVCSQPDNCHCTGMSDVVCVNRYFSWYSDCGQLDLIEYQLSRHLKAWHKRFRKPVFMTEYGADSVIGLHSDPPMMFTEEYQCEMLDRFHKVFDRLDFVVGEHVWNFADFAARQEVKRVAGNRKGVFTRERQPKMVAHRLRDRWTRRPSFR